MLIELSLFFLLGSWVVVGLAAAAYVRRAHLGALARPIVVGAALLAGFTWLLAGAMAIASVEREGKMVRAGWNLQPVLVASRDLAAGTVLDEHDVQSRPIPEQLATASTIPVDDAGEVLGKRLVAPLEKGEAITRLHVGEGAWCPDGGR